MNVVISEQQRDRHADASTSPFVIVHAEDREELVLRVDQVGDALLASRRCQSRPTFCRMKEKPTAVISGASLGALRSGR